MVLDNIEDLSAICRYMAPFTLMPEGFDVGELRVVSKIDNVITHLVGKDELGFKAIIITVIGD